MASGPLGGGSVLVEVVANTKQFHFLFPVPVRHPEGFAFHFLKNKVQLNLVFLLAWALLQSGFIWLQALEN